ncbi:restriction endonuclease subunit S [Candidatus Mycolicibacterium alkanivorans]|uniref:Restriction endonuclease subunit S n=1 Tax=Candidatus Mycolicibacterium alkanivorans TaxID=2954114 RepID=A0ABS9YTP0_9MYCO|nr:restriction endonuclease subunit S [Candidatus Mycolicibacterium alkanivorans]MCI4674580.1 restriction endonuclease subunit S [Candidatus Mycolicibacterium alkanivorans]
MSAPQTLPLVSITDWSSGGTPSRSNDAYWNGTIPWISAATLKGSRIGGSDQHLTEAGLRAGSNLAPKGATLVLVRGMALHRETRIGLAQLPVSFNQDVKALVPKAGIVPEFLLYALQARTSQIRELVSSAGSGTGVLNTQLLQRLPIWVPSQETQRTIVQAMSDADDLIATLERLIAKKHAIKQGMMQQLLTGRTRLPGLTAAWETTTVGQVCVTFSGGTPSTAHPEYYRGEIPWIASGDLNKRRIESVDGRISKLGLDRSAARLVEAGTPLIALYGATAGVAAITEIDGAINQAILAMVPFDINAEFLYQWLGTNRGSIIDRYTQGGQPNLSGAIVRDIEIPLPSPNEQKAIAQVLADGDAEIDAIRARLTKAREIKTGMMQQLLTGRTRLPVEAAS